MAAKPKQKPKTIKCVARAKMWGANQPGGAKHLIVPGEIVFVEPPAEGKRLSPALRRLTDLDPETVKDAPDKSGPKSMAEAQRGTPARRPQGA